MGQLHFYGTDNKKAPDQGAFKQLIYIRKMARPRRFERLTAWFVARYSIQLSYGRFDFSRGSPERRRALC